jgi:tight adherence protein B
MQMPPAQLLVVAAGMFLFLAMLVFAFSGPATGKAQERRLKDLKARANDMVGKGGPSMEQAMRKIVTNRASRDGFLYGLIPNPALLEKRLNMTGKGWTIPRYMMVTLGLVVIVGGGIFFKSSNALFALFGGLALGLFLPHMVVGSQIKGRIVKFNARFPDAIELMVRGLRAGLPIGETLGIVSSEIPDPVGAEFRGVADRIKIGKTMDQALEEAADRIDTPEFRFFCITLAIQRETGGNLAETLSNLADVLRKRAQMKLKISAMSSESKASAYIIGALPFLVFGIIYFMNAEYMGKFFTDQRLILAGLGGLVWMGIGAFVMRQMINFEI